MAGDHIQIAVNQERDVEPKALDALGDPANLPGAVLARVLRVRLQARNRDVVDRERRSPERLRLRRRGVEPSRRPLAPMACPNRRLFGVSAIPGSALRSETGKRNDPSQPRRNRINCSGLTGNFGTSATSVSNSSASRTTFSMNAWSSFPARRVPRACLAPALPSLRRPRCE